MGKKILIVDDSAFTRRIMRNILNGRGFTEVIEAENGREALRKYETEKPDIVFLDMVMPDLNGIEVLKQIVIMDENAKVLMLTDIGQEKIIDKCNKLGSVGYIVKPFDEEQIMDSMERNLRVKIKRKTRTKLSKLEKDKLREVGYLGAQSAASALSKMLGKTVTTKLLRSQLTSIIDLPNIIGDRETVVTGIYLPVTGSITGSVLIIFPEKNAFTLVDLLLNKKKGTTMNFDEMDKSALNEAGNILAGNCLTALSSLLDLNLIEHIPDFAHGMVGALIDNVAIIFGQKAEQALIIQVELKIEMKIKIVGYFFLLFTLEEAYKILRAIRVKVGA